MSAIRGLRLLLLVWFSASVFYLAIGWVAIKAIEPALQIEILKELKR